MAENAKINTVLNTRKQLLVSDENIGIQDHLKDFRTPHVIRSMLMQIGVSMAWLKPL